MTDRQRNAFVLLLVAGLLAASAVAIVAKKTFLGLDLKGGVELVYKGVPTPQSQVNSTSLARAVDVMRKRVDQLGVSQPEINTEGTNLIVVQLPAVHNISQAEDEVGQTATLHFYDWEANVLTPNGETVASQLQAQDQSALAISQAQSAGSPGAGSTDLYTAIKTTLKYTKQPPIGTMNSTKFNRYYLFAAPGSQACQIAGKILKYTPVAGVHCLVAGGNTTYSRAELYQNLPAGITKENTEVMVLRRGFTVFQAVAANFNKPPSQTSPSTQWYPALDDVALFGKDLKNPQQSTDQQGSPDVSFSFDSKGEHEFQNVTEAIAHRGALISGLGQKLVQHFAVELDGALVTVPTIDYTQYPDGIQGGGGAEIDGNFSISSAQQLASELRLGALPINLERVSEEQISASLGKQALHQGLIAGAAGLLVVILFLLVFYRVLGLIATTGLVIYSVYFYALIKLIPITLTLAGIAGLILTIGVAADANIVIFERVKEEVRAGRSIRQAIITGYKKGLTAIIDANVVTVMTAFILFVLATSDVKGFAFTLGVGTLVSLFTAVLATQAILMTMGNSRTIARPSALGAAKKGRSWTFDFMGASKYFFSLSGVILLIGALAIGGRGLNLGIDFTSGSQASVGLVKDASQQQVTQFVQSIGVQHPTVEHVSGKGNNLGPHAYQISFNKYTLPGSKRPGNRQTLLAALQQKFGVRANGQALNYTTVGPTFGKDVTHSAVVAIIISLLVISLYITFRFTWKFSVPVLIALMHDLLITSGVYALTGRTVTADTVAALLTILGYSLYDTIIVFDRVRENIPRMPRAAFSQIVNRSMSEVLTRSLATTTCTLLPVVALLLFGGSTLKDFAFALLIGVASGAYSSIFIASPVLTHWKEREHGFTLRRERIEADNDGHVPAYAGTGADVEPARRKAARSGRITSPDDESVSAAEFEQMKRDIADEVEGGGRTSRLSRSMAHTDEDETGSAARSGRSGTQTKLPRRSERPQLSPEEQAAAAAAAEQARIDRAGEDGDEEFIAAPDEAENEGMVADEPKRQAPRGKNRNRKHGRR